MIIRPATPADVIDLVGLEADSFGFSAWSQALVRAELAADRIVLVAEDPDLVGWASFSVGPDVAELFRVATAQSHQRSGVARALIAAGLSHVRARGAERVMLEVAESNAAARALYESLGFVVIHRRRGYYGLGEDALVMEQASVTHG